MIEHKDFLSHLCGEEDIRLDWLTVVAFLSHLCGEEGRADIATDWAGF